MLSNLNTDIQEAGHKVFSGRVHESGREQRSEDIKATVELGNTYARKMRENIDEIVRLASAGYHLIDPEDMEVFEDIRRQAVRMEVEFESFLARQVPIEVKQELGSPSYFKSEWLTTLRAKHQKKVDRQAKLIGLDTDQDKPRP